MFWSVTRRESIDLVNKMQFPSLVQHLWFDFQRVGALQILTTPMPPSRRYKQLKLGVDSFQYQYNSVVLSFTLKRKPVSGILTGNSVDWMFQSDSSIFIKLIPSGVLNKYALWYDHIPKDLDKVYNGILAAAFKAGYDLCEKDLEM